MSGMTLGRGQRRKLSRRRWLSSMGMGTAAAAFVAACSGDGEKKDTPSGANSGGSAQATAASVEEALPGQLTAAEKALATTPELEYRMKYTASKFKNLPGQKQGPKAGGTLNVTLVLTNTWDMLDPASGESSFGPVYNSLVEMHVTDFDDVHRGIRPVGDLAEKWEQPDPSTIIFTLRPGVKFQDRPPVNGRPLSIEDVRASYEAFRKAPFQAPNYTDVKSIEAVGSNQLKITFNKPAAYFLNNLLSQKHSVMPTELLGTPQSKTVAVGTGPMILKDYKTSQTIDWEKNPTYFKKDRRTGMQLPYLDAIHGQFYADRNSQIAAWKNGQIDQILWAYGIKEPKSAGVFDDPKSVFQVVSPSTWGMTHVAFKLEKPPWNDARVRQALSLAFNRKDMVQGLADGLAAEGAYPLDFTFFKDAKTGEFQEWPWRPEQLGQYQKFDIAKAKQLLQAAGFSAQKPLEFDAVGIASSDPGGYLLRHVTHLAMVDQWKQGLGDLVKPKFIALETLAYNTIARTREYEDVYLGWLTGPAYEPDGFVYAQMHSKSSYNTFGIKDPEIDAAAEAQRVEFDNAKRQVLWQKIMDRDLDQVYRAFTYHGYKTMSRRSNVFNVLDAMHAWTPGFRAPAQWGWKLPS